MPSPPPFGGLIPESLSAVTPASMNSSTVSSPALSAPAIIPARATLYLDQTGSAPNYGAIINAAITDAANHNKGVLYLKPGIVSIETPLTIPSYFHLIGEGAVEEINATSWRGQGVCLQQVRNQNTNIINIAGIDEGNTLTPMVIGARVSNMKLIGNLGSYPYFTAQPVGNTVTTPYTCTSGSNIVTGLTSNIIGAIYLGATIVLPGAGTGGASLSTYVRSVASSTSIEIGTTAITSVSAGSTVLVVTPPLGAVVPGYTAGGPGTLLNVYSAYHFRAEKMVFCNYFTRAILLSNVWESTLNDMFIIDGGFSDPTASPSDPLVIGYTGRQPMATETLYNVSWGVPDVEIVSPNLYSGADTCNLIWIDKLRIQSSSNNAVGVIVRGGNGNTIVINGQGIEQENGTVPHVVAENQNNLILDNMFFYGGGSGTAPVQIAGSSSPGVPAGFAWKTNPCPGQILLYTCYSPRVTGTVAYAGFGNGKLQANIVAISCDNPIIDVNASSGVDSLNQSLTTTTDTLTIASGSSTLTGTEGYLGGIQGYTFNLLSAGISGATVTSCISPNQIVLNQSATSSLTSVVGTYSWVPPQAGARIILNGCTNTGRTNSSAYTYILGLANAVQTESLVINPASPNYQFGLGRPSVRTWRPVSGSNSTYTAQFDDRGSIIHFTASSGTNTCIVSDLGYGVEYDIAQGNTSAVTLTAASGTTIYPTNANLVTTGKGSRLKVACNGDGTINVYSPISGAVAQAGQLYQQSTPGTYTITPPGGYVSARIRMRAPGGGAGGGAYLSTGQTGGGGGGGGAGAGFEQTLSSSTLGTAAFTSILGTPGAGGLGASSAGTGANGTSGGSNTLSIGGGFVNLYQTGGGGGQGGQTSAGAFGGAGGVVATAAQNPSGTGAASSPSGLPGFNTSTVTYATSNWQGCPGGGSTSSAAGIQGGDGPLTAGGGGGGGGVSGTGTLSPGGRGGSGFMGNPSAPGGTTLSANGSNSSTYTPGYVPSTGAGGGASQSANAGGNGGNGLQGSGGGGGGAGYIQVGGNGGNGGNPFLEIEWIFG